MRKYVYLLIIVITVFSLVSGCKNCEVPDISNEQDEIKNTHVEKDKSEKKNGLKSISFGGNHIIALKNNGEIIVWGDNSKGQCNTLENMKLIDSIEAGVNHSLAIQTDGTVIAWGDNTWGQCNVPSCVRNVKGITGGYKHSVALLEDGTVVAWGDNEYNQCEVPDELSNIIEVSAGLFHTSALSKNGEIITWGDNTIREIIIAQPYAQPEYIKGPFKAVSCWNTYILALQEDETVVGWGWRWFEDILIKKGHKNISMITAGENIAAFLKNDGTIVTLGGIDEIYNFQDYIDELDPVEYIAAGYDVIGVITREGELIIIGVDVSRFNNKNLSNLILYEVQEEPVSFKK